MWTQLTRSRLDLIAATAGLAAILLHWLAIRFGLDGIAVLKTIAVIAFVFSVAFALLAVRRVLEL
jgi:hypothetical protein